MIRLSALFTLLIAFALPVFGSAPKQIALHIALIDHMAFSDAAYNEVNTFVAEALPQLELRSIKVETSVLRNGTEAVRRKILDQLTFQSEDRISHLIIDTHGDTRNGATQLAHLGEFSETGADEALSEILEPLRGHIEPDLTIVLNSCSTLCGTETALRVRALLADLGAPDARVYGSTTPEVERPGALIGRSQWRAYFGDLAQLKLFITLGAALGVPYSIASHGHLAISIAAVSASLYAITTGLKAALARFGAVNLGRLQIYRNGELVEDRPVEKYQARYEIYGTCSALFR